MPYQHSLFAGDGGLRQKQIPKAVLKYIRYTIVKKQPFSHCKKNFVQHFASVIQYIFVPTYGAVRTQSDYNNLWLQQSVTIAICDYSNL